MMDISYIKSLLETNNIITVEAQTDEKYKQISSNQCSWCAWEFAVNCKNLMKYYYSDKSSFIELYNECLKNGSEKRKLGNKLYGENIDNDKIINEYENKFNPLVYYHFIKNKDEDFLSFLHKDLLEEFYSRTYIQINNIDNFINNTFYTEAFLVSRHGQSFFFMKCPNQMNLIFDSHVHEIGVMNNENLKKYILNDQNDGYIHLTIIKLKV